MTPLVLGRGDPVTVVAHGFGASLAETRPLLRTVPGTKVLFSARGHVGGPASVVPGYAELAEDLDGIASAHGATQGLGVSMGAGAMLRLLSLDPDRFRRVVLFLPASIDRPRQRPAGLAEALRAHEVGQVRAYVRAEVPEGLGAGADRYVEARTEFLLSSPGLADLVDALATDVPVADRAALGAVTADVLLLGQEGDVLHPAQVARELAAALPRASLVVFDEPGAMFRARGRLTDLISRHLSGIAPPG